MFEQLFSAPAAIVRHRAAPYSAERERYLRYLAGQHYSRRSLKAVAYSLLAIVLQTDLASGRSVSGSNIRDALRRRRSLRSHKPSSALVREDFQRTATLWFEFLGKLAAERPPLRCAPSAVKQFETFLRDERGFSLSTIEHYCWHAHRLSCWLEHAGRTLRQVRLQDVDAYMAERAASGWGRSSMPAVAGAVRSFLRFAELRRLCPPGLAGGVASPRMYTDERLPEGLEWAAVRRLVTSARGNSRDDIRDRAIFLLLSVYGLRCCEIAALRLDDINRDNGTISVRRPKQRHTQQYPLEATTGNAILRYLRRARPPTECRSVFLNLLAPSRAITRISIYHAIRKRLRNLGLYGRSRGPHSLRHACARRLLARGFTFKEVGDHLGHRCSGATRIYAKVDVKSLREVAKINLRGIL